MLDMPYSFLYYLRMHFFSKILPLALSVALLAPAAFASEGLYNREYVRGFIGLKGDFRSMRSKAVKELNLVTKNTGKSYKKQFADGHLDIGAEYNQLMTWFDIDFMPLTQTRAGGSEWYAYGLTWMWGYKLFHANSLGNIIPSIGPGFELLNVRKPSPDDKLVSSMGPTLNTEIEFRLQAAQFAAGIYGGYKVIRQDDENLFDKDINFDKVFVGLKLSWTMLSGFQKQAKDME